MVHSKQALELEYYIQEGISPVHYKLSNLKTHFEIRESLYRLLGILPNFLLGKDILEVAPGSGHNSIYTASLLPKSYDLVEPNPYGNKDILKIFKNLKNKHTKPRLYKKSLEDFNINKLYDLVITEGWPGGHLEYDKKMFRKLSRYVKPGGLLLITFLPPIGAISTYLRRLISYRFINKKDKFVHKTNVLKRIFSSHLNKMKSMGRTHDHWIQDSLLNPYIVVGYNTPYISIKNFGKRFEIFNSVPKMSTDWRWYKSLYGKKKIFNKIYLDEYYSTCHCLINYKINGFKRSKQKNKLLEELSIKLSLLTKDYETKGFKAYKYKIKPILNKIINNVKFDLPSKTVKALKEVDKVLSKQNLRLKDLKLLKEFTNLFGREQCYLSFSKKK